MAESAFHCSVITPEAKPFEGEVVSVVIPAHDGEIGVLRDRAPLLCKLGAGRMQIRTTQGEQAWFIDGGFARVLDNRVIVLTQKALRPDQIDRGQARSQLEEALAMRVTDDVSARRRVRLEASARAQLRIAP